jgi:hypothetical protein
VGIEQGILPGCGSVISTEGEREAEVRPGKVEGKPRYESIDREQLCWRRVDVERLRLRGELSETFVSFEHFVVRG